MFGTLSGELAAALNSETSFRHRDTPSPGLVLTTELFEELSLGCAIFGLLPIFLFLTFSLGESRVPT